MYFITVVTYNREPVLTRDSELFWHSWGQQKLMAWAVLPEHFHAMLKPTNRTISQVIHRFKITYSRGLRDQYRSGRVWQNRFWDHVIRSQEDFNHHLDYIHYNPVKHGLAIKAADYKLSSFSTFLEQGYYVADWDAKPLEFCGDFGE
jgi:putative transposase